MKKINDISATLGYYINVFCTKERDKGNWESTKNANYADAKSAASAADALIGNMDDKSKAKFYLLRAKALYANGAGTDADIDEAISSLDKLKDLESKIGKLKYTQEANEMTTNMLSSF